MIFFNPCVQGVICAKKECAGMQAVCDFGETAFFQFFSARDNLEQVREQVEVETMNAVTGGKES